MKKKKENKYFSFSTLTRKILGTLKITWIQHKPDEPVALNLEKKKKENNFVEAKSNTFYFKWSEKKKEK